VFPATAMSHWATYFQTGGQYKVTYAERFRHQYQQFKMQAQQTKSGTPLEHAPFLTEGKRAELRAQNVYTVEALAAIEGLELKNLGTGGRELKNAAEAYIEEGKQAAPNLQIAAELEALKAKNQLLEEDMARIRERGEAIDDDPQFSNMTTDELRDYVTINTGHAPHGSLNRKTLLRMADAARKEKAA
jgi:hypothetical protein